MIHARSEWVSSHGSFFITPGLAIQTAESTIYMRRSGIENASKEPTAVNPAIDQNTMRKAWEISA
jgi:hypothetical protein